MELICCFVGCLCYSWFDTIMAVLVGGRTLHDKQLPLIIRTPSQWSWIHPTSSLAPSPDLYQHHMVKMPSLVSQKKLLMKKYLSKTKYSSVKKSKINLFQSRERLYNYQYPFVCQSVCPSVTKTPKKLKINHSTLPTTTPPSSSSLRHHTQHHTNHYSQHNIQHHSQHHTQTINQTFMLLQRLLSFSACFSFLNFKNLI